MFFFFLPKYVARFGSHYHLYFKKKKKKSSLLIGQMSFYIKNKKYQTKNIPIFFVFFFLFFVFLVFYI